MRKSTALWAIASCIFVVSVKGNLPAVAQTTGFLTTGSMDSGRTWHTATLLNNGKVLVVGGLEYNYEASADPELYDPASGTFTLTGNATLPPGLYGHTATLLNNGKVLIVGGWIGGPINIAYLYDPATEIFTPAGSTMHARHGHTATLLSNGKVLIVGRDPFPDDDTRYAELYDPETGTFTATGETSVNRFAHTATLLKNGKVLIAGGGQGMWSPPLENAELYDTKTGRFEVTENMAEPRQLHTATLLNDGKVLLAGGIKETDYLFSAELFDPSTGRFTATGSMTRKSALHTATLLTNGMVLFSGGRNGGELIANAELYDPSSEAFTDDAGMIHPRIDHTATLLNSGMVLITGGQDLIWYHYPEAELNVQTVVVALQSLFSLVDSFNLRKSITNTLDSLLLRALETYQDGKSGDEQAVVKAMMTFIRTVEAQRGRGITSAQADQLIFEANRILAVLSEQGTP
jgi:hypothetical protein